MSMELMRVGWVDLNIDESEVNGVLYIVASFILCGVLRAIMIRAAVCMM